MNQHPEPSKAAADGENCAVLLRIQGRVQGVGFRPVVFCLAREWGLRGWVLNDAAGAEVALLGMAERVARFRAELPGRLPAAADIQSVREQHPAPDANAFPRGFEIRESPAAAGPRTAEILPDLATCPACLKELFDPSNRRHRYPFINCTHCGPRFSIIEALPYDRERTTMRAFTMCPDCAAEYADPRNRRFHAQPNACATCGPELSLRIAEKTGARAEGAEALRAAEEVLRAGQIVAVKGLGGFHLMCDARDAASMARLRQRKHRDEKPFAVLFPTLEAARTACEMSEAEEAWLVSQAAPIVLLRRHPAAVNAKTVADGTAPHSDRLGVMLPYTPLHHLLASDLGFPLVATSGNLTDEPICTDNEEAMMRLGKIADAFLLHNRPIARPMEDSVLQVLDGRGVMIRRGRGLAPYTFPVPGAPDGWVAAGAQLKGTVAVCAGGRAVMGPHIGDLDHAAGARLWRCGLDDLLALHGLTATRAAVDTHPDYVSTRAAATLGVPLIPVQHHRAHLAACMAENHLDGPVLGVVWDGTGRGDDGSVWGGEFFRAQWPTSDRTAATDTEDFRRVAHLRTFSLMGGDAAAREPRRAALGVWREADVPGTPPGFAPDELALLEAAARGGVNVVRTSSAGRLFDAVAALLGVCLRMTYEGQAAARLEALAAEVSPDDDVPPYPFELDGEILDWTPMMRELATRHEPAAWAAARFHATLTAMILAVAKREALKDICLTGGCFQNRLLTAQTTAQLTAAGFRGWTSHDIPPNDAGISLGQTVWAVHFGHFC